MNTAYHDTPIIQTDIQVDALTVEQLNQATQLAQQTKQPLLKVLEEVSELTPDVFVQALGLLVRYPVLTISQLYHLQPDFDVVPFTQAEKIGCLAVRDKHDALYLVHANPFEANLYSKLDLLVNEPATWALAHTDDLNVYLSHHEANMRALGDEVSEHHAERNEDEQGIEDISLRSISEDTSPIVKFVRSTLYDALKAGASDVHLETDQNGLKVKYRIDGVLSHVGGIQGLAQAEQVISRVKVMSDLDIAERRIPQDGRFKVMALGREIDLRVSIMPSVLGEDAVLRVLDRQALSEEAQGLSLEILGFAPDIMARFRLLAEEPYGMLLVTGPTGSGKTTTLYGIISEINHGTDKIITIEDPVEYQLPGVLQIPVNEKKGLTFAKGLRSILRHDPDKIMVGEIRDNETAQIAVQSALTGHLVLTTVHANNVFDVIGRFTNMGVDPYNFVSAMNGILAQRLVRVNCPHCLTEDKPDAALVEKSGLNAEQISDFRFKKGQGCGQCHGLGFKGRKAIAELLCFNDEIRELIVTRQPVRKIKEAAYANGTRTMREAALLLVKNGETTLEEINRVTTLA
ncbi:MAG TPA: type II/IV secretion system protein [Methylophaga aminisulfidivorans]|jgi:general secretion pathway protein E|uniref:GspE/PulE family protein n=2 Tax=Piscirickettsiaceae TaxID=135616 RepID=UPI001A1293BC|nr:MULTISPECIES: GspE/PulE family protein [Methylophaga]HIM40232.1 type II/IV secretion system protein [Methylophaga aminisulfidivorans]